MQNKERIERRSNTSIVDPWRAGREEENKAWPGEKKAADATLVGPWRVGVGEALHCWRAGRKCRYPTLVDPWPVARKGLAVRVLSLVKLISDVKR